MRYLFAIRRSHCSHADRDKESHECVGTCEITRDGIRLQCSLCGDENMEKNNSLTARDEAFLKGRPHEIL